MYFMLWLPTFRGYLIFEVKIKMESAVALRNINNNIPDFTVSQLGRQIPNFHAYENIEPQCERSSILHERTYWRQLHNEGLHWFELVTKC
jgi:hypothetical protein